MLLRILSLLLSIHFVELSSTGKTVDCGNLLVGQYRCQQPTIDDRTQEPLGCERVYVKLDGEEQFIDTAPISCHAAPRIKCTGGTYNATLDVYVFEKRTPCRWTNGKYYRTTLLLSLFLGMRSSHGHFPYALFSLCRLGIFGIDRIYLGYYVSGLLKLFTCGFMLVGALVDFLYVHSSAACISADVALICLD